MLSTSTFKKHTKESNNMNILEDPKLQYIIETKKLTQSSINGYRIVFETIFEITKLTPTEILQIVREEQRNPFKIINDKKVFIELEDRFITQLLLKFIRHLENSNLKNSSIQTKQRILRAFFKAYNIELPTSVPVIINRKRARKKDLPTVKDVKKAVEYVKNIRDRLIFKLLRDTGLRGIDARKLKIGTFRIGTFPYHKGMNIHEFIRTDPSNIVICFDIIPEKTKKHGNNQITFASPEVTELIFQHLREREDLGLPLDDEQPLLMSYKTHSFLSHNVFARIFSNVNDTLFNGAMVNGKRFFRAHNLRKLFRTTLKNNLQEIDQPGFNDMNVSDIIRIMCGHTPENDIEEIYDAIDIDVLREYYMQVMPKLTDKNLPVETLKSPKYLELELEKNIVLKENQELKNNINTIVKQEIQKVLTENNRI